MFPGKSKAIVPTAPTNLPVPPVTAMTKCGVCATSPENVIVPCARLMVPLASKRFFFPSTPIAASRTLPTVLPWRVSDWVRTTTSPMPGP